MAKYSLHIVHSYSQSNENELALVGDTSGTFTKPPCKAQRSFSSWAQREVTTSTTIIYYSYNGYNYEYRL